MTALRHVPTQGAYNIRDLGGYPTSDGMVTRWNQLYRSDALVELASEDWDLLERIGIRTIVDLRSDYESQFQPIEPRPSMCLYHRSLMREVDEMSGTEGIFTFDPSVSIEDVKKLIKSATVDYGQSVKDNISVCAEVMGIILERLGIGPVLFLCSAGKDRTGIIASLSLYLCGVVREDIVADYMVSAIYNKRGVNKRLERDYGADILKMFPDTSVLEEALGSDAKNMEKLLGDFDDMDIQTLLDENGFGTQSQEQLRMLLREKG